MTAANRSRAGIDTDRWLMPIIAVLAFAAGVFGVLPFLAPGLVADLGGFTGQDVFIYRLVGAGSFSYTVALAQSWREGWRGLRIPIAGMAVFAVGSIIACLAAIVEGGATWPVYLILVASTVFLGLHLLLLSNPPQRGEPVGSGPQDVADRVIYLVAFGTIAAIGTGTLALVLGGEGAKLLGNYTGTDSIMYRQAGAATLGTALAGFLSIRSRRWAEIRGGLWGAFAFNTVALIATVIEITRPGGINLLSIAILGVSVIVSIGLAWALQRGGR
jgi:hypothetical protein